MDVLAISSSEQESIFSILSAVLHLGNVAFMESPNDDGILVKEIQCVEVVAFLLRVNSASLLEDITFRVTVSEHILIQKICSFFIISAIAGILLESQDFNFFQ